MQAGKSVVAVRGSDVVSAGDAGATPHSIIAERRQYAWPARRSVLADCRDCADVIVVIGHIEPIRPRESCSPARDIPQRHPRTLRADLIDDATERVPGVAHRLGGG